ncbi:HAD family hydrolase [Luteipulveratus flavus]|uniref:HAD-IA family hydrolase n=1 Tax=Luteipulveratus flavus TaxID=3031728 RepID=A0ABT6C5G7_9MICO|nr:HAD-IA family hydrolase [Luteipulveratus sp. YIM 133296]MDF8264183.1 HAD-IA family hydrolase [Luteipulveratus sp. YIM 133296]
MTAPIRAVLWDADGVLQHGHPAPGHAGEQVAASWPERLQAIGGPGFAEALFAAEKGPLRGEEPFRPVIQRLLEQRGLSVSADEVLALWDDVHVDADAFALVDRVRAQGVQCVLATNQQDHRVALMRETLGYDAHFDRTYYSSEVGAMKPEPEYFRRVLDDLGMAAAATLFIDDSLTNVESAAALGIVAERHDPAAGVSGLRALLARHGIVV